MDAAEPARETLPQFGWSVLGGHTPPPGRAASPRQLTLEHDPEDLRLGTPFVPEVEPEEDPHLRHVRSRRPVWLLGVGAPLALAGAATFAIFLDDSDSRLRYRPGLVTGALSASAGLAMSLAALVLRARRPASESNAGWGALLTGIGAGVGLFFTNFMSFLLGGF